MKTGHHKIYISELDRVDMTKLCILRLFDCKLGRIQAGLLVLIVIIGSSIIMLDDGESLGVRFYSGIR